MIDTMYVFADGSVFMPGVDWGPNPVVHHVDGNLFVMKVPSHKSWGGIGRERLNQPTVLHVFDIIAVVPQSGERHALSRKPVAVFELERHGNAIPIRMDAESAAQGAVRRFKELSAKTIRESLQ